MRGAGGAAILAMTASIGGAAFGVRFLAEYKDPSPAIRAVSSGHALPSWTPLAGLRAAARRPDADGRAHYELAAALRELVARGEDAANDEAMGRLLLEGVDAGEFAWARRPTSSSYATVLGDLHGLLASRGGTLARIRHGRRAAELYARGVQLDPRNPLAHVGVGISMLETPPLFGGSFTALP